MRRLLNIVARTPRNQGELEFPLNVAGDAG